MHWATANRALTVLALAALAACGSPTLPAVPSELTTGVAIYEHANYAGESALITEDVKNLKNVKGPCLDSQDPDNTDTGWSDCISSIRVAPGWRATLYRDDGFKGQELQIVGDVPNLTTMPGTCSKGGFNDCTTAIRVFRP